MLHALTEYATKRGIEGEAGFTKKRIRWIVSFSPKGDYLGLIERCETGAKPGTGEEFDQVPHLKLCGDTPMRQFLVDTTKFIFLFGIENPPVKLKKKHTYFLDRLRDASKIEPFLGVVAEAISKKEIRKKICLDLQSNSPKAKAEDNVTFAEVSGQKPRIIVEQNHWHDWWRTYFPTLFKNNEKKQGKVRPQKMRCLISGILCEPSPTHPKIKGIGEDVGGKAETTLVSFNKEAFCSYGLAQSANAAIEAKQAEQYAAALNDLIANHSKRLTGTKIVYWYIGKDSVPNELDPISFLLEASNEETEESEAQHKASSFLDSIRCGKREDLLQYRYHVLTLSGSSARVMVRDWTGGQFGNLVSNIDSWFDDLSITSLDTKRIAKKPKFFAVLGGIVRELKDISPPVETKLWRVAIQNEPIPQFALAQALARTKVNIIRNEAIRTAQIGLIKAYHLRKGDKAMKPYLNKNHPSPAYHCGRLMAVYADLQYAALGDVGAGIVQRYYAAASATPALVLGRLSRGSQFHLNKLEGGLAYWYKKRLADIWSSLEDSIPKALNLEEQSLFALGYYQQMATSNKSEENENTFSKTKGEEHE